MATRVWTNDDSEFPPLPTLVDFVRAADPRAAVACTGRGKIFHVACDKETRGFENGESILEANKTLAAAADLKADETTTSDIRASRQAASVVQGR